MGASSTFKITWVLVTHTVILAERILVQSQPRHIVQESLSQNIPSQKRAGGVAQGEGPEFKPQFCFADVSTKTRS
jgi:hypothetical protein